MSEVTPPATEGETFLSHLVELRNRLMRSIIAVVIVLTSATAADPLARKPFGQTGLAVPPIAVGCAPTRRHARGVRLRRHAKRTPWRRSAPPSTAPSPTSTPRRSTATARASGGSASSLRELGGLPADAFLQTKQGRDPKTTTTPARRSSGGWSGRCDLLGVDRIEVVYLHDPEWTTFEDADRAGRPGRGAAALSRSRASSATSASPVDRSPLANPVRRDGHFRRGHQPQPLHPAQPLRRAAARGRGRRAGWRCSTPRPTAAACWPKGPTPTRATPTSRRPTEMIDRVRRIAAICERHGVPLAAAGAPVLDPRPADHRDDRRHEPPRAHHRHPRPISPPRSRTRSGTRSPRSPTTRTTRRRTASSAGDGPSPRPLADNRIVHYDARHERTLGAPP